MIKPNITTVDINLKPSSLDNVVYSTSEAQAGFSLHLDPQEMQQAAALYEKLRTPVFDFDQTGIAPALYSDWQQAGIIAKTEPPEKLPFLEYLWLSMAQQLHLQGMTPERLKAVKDYLFTELRIQGTEQDPALLEKVKAELLKVMKPAEVADTLELVKSGQLDELLQTFGVRFTWLESMVYAALYRKQEVGLLLFPTGEMVPWLDEMQGMGPEAQQIKGSTHTYLSITQHLAAFILEEDKAGYIARTSLLSEAELQVVRAIRSKSFREVTITFDEKRGMTLRTTSGGQLDESLSSQLKETLNLKNYQSVDLENRGGSRLHFTKEHRRRV